SRRRHTRSKRDWSSDVCSSDLLIHLMKRLHKTTVFVTHDMQEALKLADRICILRDGKVVQVGTPHELMHEPVNDFVRKFVGGSYGVEQTDIDLRHIVFPLKHAQVIYEETIQDTASFDEVLAALAKNERLTVEAEGEPIGNINRQA